MNESSKILKTKRLLIKPFSEKHLTPRYVGWLNNSALMRHSEQRHKIHTLEMCRLYWRSFNNSANLLWAIEDVTNGYGHIGNINAYVDTHNKIADIGVLVGEVNVRGYGYGYEAFKGVSEYLFQNMEIRKIVAGTVSANSSMIKLMNKMKMREDGIRRRHYLIEGEEVDIIHMALFKQDISAE
jgi:RimJ/RimL family protein N-acetyltransferase